MDSASAKHDHHCGQVVATPPHIRLIHQRLGTHRGDRAANGPTSAAVENNRTVRVSGATGECVGSVIRHGACTLLVEQYLLHDSDSVVVGQHVPHTVAGHDEEIVTDTRRRENGGHHRQLIASRHTRWRRR